MCLLAGVIVSCGGSATAGDGSSSSTDAGTFALQVATTDLVAGEPSRVQVGIFASDHQQGTYLLTSGTIEVTLRPYEGGSGTEVAGQARYIPAPGTAGDATGTPALTAPDISRGVYEIDDVAFDAPGIWEAEVTFDLDGSPMSLTSQFEVLAEHALPAPGDPAIRSKNLTMKSDADPQAIDSRAQDGAPIPDPELHQETIAGALAEHRPVLVLFATPVYCVSQFCGPTTDALQRLAAQGPADVAFIHVEIYADHGSSTINEAAADWLLRNNDLTEPWLFLIGRDGTIVDRWGPLFDVAQVRAALDAL